MRKIVIASDSFKGTLSSIEIAAIFKRVAQEIIPNCEVISLPIADGGEGTLECFANIFNGEFNEIDTVDANCNAITAKYYLCGDTAFIESAQVIGLPKTKVKDPSKTTTYGIGKLIEDAINRGAKQIILGLGGTSANDGGCGLAASLGVVFKNGNGDSFVPVGGTLKDIASIEIPTLLDGIKIVAMCDVKNPLFGSNGASYVYAPQKGADIEMVNRLDKGLEHLATIMNNDKENWPGAGAAGGLGYGLLSFLNAQLKPGIETILDLSDFDKLIKDADLVVSGEGRLDSQSFSGKVVDGILKRCKNADVPLVLICGSATNEGLEKAKENGIDKVIISTPIGVSLDDLINKACFYYANSVRDMLKNI